MDETKSSVPSNRVEVPLGEVQRASVEDSYKIIRLCNSLTETTFGITTQEQIEELIKHSVLSLCQFHSDRELIVGFVAFKDYPNIPALDPSAWEENIVNYYKLSGLTSRNTLFIHLLCWEKDNLKPILYNLFRGVFMNDSYLMNIIHIKLPNTPLELDPDDPHADSMFRRVKVTLGVPGCKAMNLLNTPYLRITTRAEVCPKMRIRRAVEEDNDDLVNIIDQQSTRLRELYGDFFISEFVSGRSGSTTRQLLVAERNELAVGVMFFNTDVPLEELDLDYDLSPYFGLRKLRVESKFNMGDVGSIGEELVLSKVDTSELTIASSSTFFLRDYVLDFIKNLTMESSAPMLSMKEIPISLSALETTHHYGAPNVFMMELFAMDRMYDERYGFDILEVAFELYSDLDYCAILIPTCEFAYPLLEHFTLVTQRPGKLKLYDKALYLTHRNSICGRLQARLSEHIDKHPASVITRRTAPIVFKSFMDVMEYARTTHPAWKSYVMLSEDQPIGIATIGPLNERDEFFTNYNASKWLGTTVDCGVIVDFVMSPLFEPHARWFARELLRLTGYNTLTWTFEVLKFDKKFMRKRLMSLANHMVPLKPRVFVPGDDNQQSYAYRITSNPTVACILSKSMTSLPRIEVNRRIIVLGSSRIAMAFLEGLLFGPDSAFIYWTNITVISKYGIPSFIKCTASSKLCFTHDIKDGYLKCLPYRFYIDIIVGSVIAIDRQKQCIILEDNTKKFYDDLILTPSLQYQMPNYLNNMPNDKVAINLNKCSHIPMDDPDYVLDRIPIPVKAPKNLFIVNSIYEAHVAFGKVYRWMRVDETSDLEMDEVSKDNTRYLIVCGHTLHAYCCMNGLLDLGVKGHRIVYVESCTEKDKLGSCLSIFHSAMVEGRVKSELEAAGIKIFKGKLSKWDVDDRGMITSAEFIIDNEAIKIPAILMFYYGTRGIDYNLFIAVNVCGLVYNGGIVIDDKYRTSDSHIYAAGPGTKFSFKVRHPPHPGVNPGSELAKIISKKFNPIPKLRNQENTAHSLLTPSLLNRVMEKMRKLSVKSGSITSSALCMSASNARFASKYGLSDTEAFNKIVEESLIGLPDVKCKMISCALPTGLHFFHAFDPQQSSNHFGHILETNAHGDYFRIYLDENHCVKSITCLSKRKFNPIAMTRLYGRHSKTLGNLYLRYKLGKIKDFYQYFNEPWIMALYLDTFKELLWNLNNIEIYRGDEKIGTFSEVIALLLEETEDPKLLTGLDRGVHAELIHKWKNFNMDEAVEAQLALWLRDHQYVLKQYATTPMN